jgi:hypothetical protein
VGLEVPKPTFTLAEVPFTPFIEPTTTLLLLPAEALAPILVFQTPYVFEKPAFHPIKVYPTAQSTAILTFQVYTLINIVVKSSE